MGREVLKLTAHDGRTMYVDIDGNVYRSSPSLNGIGDLFRSVGNVFAKKKGGSGVGNFLRSVKAAPKRIFGKKEGGSWVGNNLRKIFPPGGGQPPPQYDYGGVIADVEVVELPVEEPFHPVAPSEALPGNDPGAEKGDDNTFYWAIGGAAVLIAAGAVILTNN